MRFLILTIMLANWQITSGSVISSLTAHDTLVVCADTRFTTTNPGRLPSSGTMLKLRKLAKNAVFGVTGDTARIRNSDGLVVYDAGDLVTSFPFGDTDIAIEQITNFEKVLGPQFAAKLKRVPVNEWPPDGTNANHSLFEIVFYYLDNSRNFRLHITRLVWEGGRSKVGWIDVPIDELKQSKLETTGSGYLVIDELINGQNPAFDILRKGKQLMGFIQGRGPAENVSQSEVETFLPRLIKIISEHIHLLHSLHDISPECQCLTLNNNGVIKSWSK